jgi:hypothetical protein
VPDAPRVDTAGLLAALESPDPRLQDVLCALLDRLAVPLSGVRPAAGVVALVQALQAADADTRAQATSDLLAEMSGRPHVVLQLVRRDRCCAAESD